ncbi:MAG: GNAT family N-acetyltransferase [Promethearchaeota archaeon]
MALGSIQIKKLIPNDLSEDLWTQYFDHQDRIKRELDPDSPPSSRENAKNFMLNPNPHYEIFDWIALNEDETKIIGTGSLYFENQNSPSYHSNKNIGNIYISVDKAYRRNKIGTEFLKIIVKVAKENELTTLHGSYSLEPGKEFCNYYKCSIGSKRAISRLKLIDVDWDMISSWKSEGQKRAKNVSLERFSEVSEKDIEAYTKLYTEIEHQAPDYEGEVKSTVVYNPEKRRHIEKLAKENGYDWITIISREPNGEISGLTEIWFTSKEPYWIEQELTGVKKEFRSRGIGKWLKAEMLLFIRDNYPTVEYIQTGNATANTPMLSINERMGFKKCFDHALFKFEIDKLAPLLRL